ncbi:ArsR/SmtB family transcription factor [Geotoga petraea]|jgi:ArsR family transcriptional regulator|uniref:Transcriptional regulator, ArsR family n=1 Tax=Geotoga petraea TaxID=28234 RepID=A0A1G6KP16_9BACT|nr:metalloregulator ArsR/SmtB family transcription factor [Geotoga petraea]SDC32637.1 transcriptional regulator, ArsR family [Geotoga petraea]
MNLNEYEVFKVADLFKAFSDETRVQIINILSEKELCVSDIVEVLDKNQTTISHQLRILRQSGFVYSRRDGRKNYYSLDEHISEIFKQAVNHIKEVEEI